MDVCNECLLELKPERILRFKIAAKDYCAMCFGVHQAIVDNKFMVQAQTEFEAKKRNRT
jgi:hypothetical protein